MSSLRASIFLLIVSLFIVASKDIPPPPKHDGESHMMQRLYMQDVDKQINKWDPKKDKQNVWELSGLFEGDIMMPSESVESERNAVLDDTLRWHDGVVPYYISDDFGNKKI